MLGSSCKEESRGTIIAYGMEEQSLESLAGSSNVELVMEPSVATATCTSGRWVFLAKGTALEVYDASGLTELVPLSPSKGISHFPFIVELLVNLRDGFSGRGDDDDLCTLYSWNETQTLSLLGLIFLFVTQCTVSTLL